MDRNVKIAKELVRLAKSLLEVDNCIKVYRSRMVNDVSISFAEFKLTVYSPVNHSRDFIPIQSIIETAIDDIVKLCKQTIGLSDEDIETDIERIRYAYYGYVRLVVNRGGLKPEHYNSDHIKMVNKAIRAIRRMLNNNGFTSERGVF